MFLKQSSLSEVLPAPGVSCILERHCSLVCAATVPCQALLGNSGNFQIGATEPGLHGPKDLRTVLDGLL